MICASKKLNSLHDIRLLLLLLSCANKIVVVYICVLYSVFLRVCSSVSLDPDEDKRDTTIFDGLKNYMLNELSDDECQHLKTVTLRNLAKRAQSLKALRPPRGLSFSLQQQRTCCGAYYLSQFRLLSH